MSASTNAGWTQQTSGTSPICTPFAGAGMASFNSFSINGTTSEYELNSPAMTFAGGSYRIKFNMYKDNGYSASNDRVEVFFNTVSGSTGGTSLGTVSRYATVNGWNSFTFLIPGNPSGQGYISLKATSEYGNNIFVDEVVIENLPACGEPTALVSSAVTSSTATVTWSAPGVAPANGYKYYYATTPVVPTNTTTPNGSVAAGILTTNLSGLSSSTTYYFYVRSVCSVSSSSPWSNGISFTTACASISSLPWTENFDTLTALGSTNFPSCWFKENGDWATSNATTYNTPRSGTNYLRDAWSATNEYIWTAGFTLTAGTSYDFSYWTQGDGGTGWTCDTFVNSSQISTGTPTQLGVTYSYPGTGTYTPNETYVQIKNTFVPTTTATYYFAIRVNQPDNAPWYVSFDDFGLEVTPTCVAPTAVISSATTANGATISWTAPTTAPANGYAYFVSTTNTTPAANATPTGTVAVANSIVLSGLTTNTVYYFWVRAVCSVSDSSPWAGSTTFNTTPVSTCAAVTTPADGATGVAVGTITFTWSAVSNAVSYDLFSGTTAANVTTLVGNYTTNTTQLNVNNYGTTIYWKVVPKNAGGSAIGFPVWSFTTQTPPGFCLSAPNGLWPTATFTPPTCDETTANTITTSGFAGEYSNVNVVAGQGYQFSSSIPTDFLTISVDNGLTAAAFGTTPVTWTAAATGVIRFYNHVDNQCTANNSSRTRSVTCGSSLSTNNIDSLAFNFYPNPVNDILHLHYAKDISNITVYNLLGQSVLVKAINAADAQIDMSNLSQGTYIIKVLVDASTKNIKVYKN